jgi:hypothetical protein
MPLSVKCEEGAPLASQDHFGYLQRLLALALAELADRTLVPDAADTTIIPIDKIDQK